MPVVSRTGRNWTDPNRCATIGTVKRLPIVLAAAAYLALFGAALAVWIGSPGLTLPAAILCGTPSVLCAVIMGRYRGRITQFVAGTLAFVVMAPILLLMWGAERADIPPPPPTENAVGIDEAALFAGALGVQKVTPQGAGFTMLQSGVFSDGTELRVMRFATSTEADAHMAMLAAAQDGRPFTLGGRPGMQLDAGATLSFIEAHGHDLVQIAAPTEALALAHLGGLPPGTAKAPPPPEPRRIWPGAVGFSVAHALCFFLFIVWGASVTTPVRPAANITTVSEDELRARMRSLHGAEGLRVTVSTVPGTDDLMVDYQFPDDEARSHHMILRFEAANATVRVRERSGVRGAAPRDASEADMRAPGSVGIDPTLPQAQVVYGRARHASLLEPDVLAAVPLHIAGQRVTVPPEHARTVNDRSLAYLVGAVITRSGWTFRPILFGR